MDGNLKVLSIFNLSYRLYLTRYYYIWYMYISNVKEYLCNKKSMVSTQEKMVHSE